MNHMELGPARNLRSQDTSRRLKRLPTYIAAKAGWTIEVIEVIEFLVVQLERPGLSAEVDEAQGPATLTEGY